MKRTALAIRCVPRYGYKNTEVRTVDLDLPHDADELALRQALTFYFAVRGISDAIYDLDTDDSGYFAVVNDDIYAQAWGTPLL
jgi:hypothetical protein